MIPAPLRRRIEDGLRAGQVILTADEFAIVHTHPTETMEIANAVGTHPRQHPSGAAYIAIPITVLAPLPTGAIDGETDHHTQLVASWAEGLIDAADVTRLWTRP